MKGYIWGRARALRVAFSVFAWSCELKPSKFPDVMLMLDEAGESI